MLPDDVTRAAIETGRRHADTLLRDRARALERRAQALAEHPAPLELRADAVSAKAALLAEAVLTQSAGYLVAEGDSWFDYPLHDVLDELEDGHGYDVESVPHRGDPMAATTDGGNQLCRFTRQIEKLLGRGVVPKAILVSGGDNDVAGEQFGLLLNYARSSVAGLSALILHGVVDERVRIGYIPTLSAITEVCRHKLGRPLPIVVHGYDFPVADGRGCMGGWWFLPGPDAAEHGNGNDDVSRRLELARELVDRFNAMLAGLADLPDFRHVHYVDLRNTLSTALSYQDWRATERHPSERGFRRIVERFDAVLRSLP